MRQQEKSGKYTIGARVLDNDKTVIDGIYVMSKYDARICQDLHSVKKDEDAIYALDNLETAQNFIRYLSRLYRYEFRHRAKSLGVPTNEFRFYLVKLSDKRFDAVDIGETHNVITKTSSKRYKFFGDRNHVHLMDVKMQ